MLQLVMANERSPLGFGHSGHAVGRPVGQAIVPAGGLSRPPETLNRPLTNWARISPASCLEGMVLQSPRNSSRNREAGWKARLQPGLAAP